MSLLLPPLPPRDKEVWNKDTDLFDGLWFEASVRKAQREAVTKERAKWAAQFDLKSDGSVKTTRPLDEIVRDLVEADPVFKEELERARATQVVSLVDVPPLPAQVVACLNEWAQGYARDAVAAVANQRTDASWQGRVDALQAKLDAVMLEHCPEEMTPEQIATWRSHQKQVQPDEARRIEASLTLAEIRSR